MKYYFDTCIWRDFCENRFGPRGRPLGKYATKLLAKLMKSNDTILYSDCVIYELQLAFSLKELSDMMRILETIFHLEKVEITELDWLEARRIASKRSVPNADALHALLARKNGSIVITQDFKDFKKLTDIVKIKRPEEIL